MKNNKIPGRLFYKVVAAILLPTFFLSSITAVFAEESVTTTQSETVTQTPNTTAPESLDTITTTTPSDTTSMEQPSVAVSKPATDPIESLKTENIKLEKTSPSGAKSATASSSIAGTSSSSSAPVQQTDQPQLSVASKSKLIPQVDNTTGALRYNFPVTIAKGRNNMTPDIALQYNSQNIATDSIVGYGWNISIPYIQRENKHGVDQIYSSTYNDFTTSDNGELGQISGVNYQLKSDDGSFSKYVFSSNTWTVTDKTGVVYKYGTTAASQQNDSVTTANVYKWMLDSATDTNGNSISYTYFKDQGQIYPDTITYTNTSGGTGIFSVVFTHAAAASTGASSYVTGFGVITGYNITAITSKISGVTRHKYDLTYVNGSNNNKQLLSTIIETGYNTSGTSTVFPATRLSYTTGNGKTFSTTAATLPTYTLPGGTTRQDARLGDSGDNAYVWPYSKTGTLIDVNGDGYPDWINSELSDYATGSSSNGKFYDVWLGSASGWILSTSWTAAIPVDSTGKVYSLSDSQNNKLVDINGDGLPDWVISTPGSTVNFDTAVVWLNNGSGWTKTTTWTMPTMTVSGTVYGVAVNSSTPVVHGVPNNIGPSGYNYFTNLVDVNNDGLVDLVQTSSDNFGASTISDHHAVYLNTGTGWTKSTTWTMPVHPTGSGTYFGSSVDNLSGTNVILDVNGDGLPDWIETGGYSASSTENYVLWLNTGAGWVRSTTWALPVHTVTPPTGAFPEQGVRLGSSYIICDYGSGSYNCAVRVNALADVNGDGLPDFVETYNNLSGSTVSFSEYNDVWLNNGKNGWIQKTSWYMPQYYGYGTPIRLGNDGVYSVQLSDVNNDGLLDFVASCDCGRTGSAYYPQSSNVFLNSGSGWSVAGYTLPNRSASYPYDGSVLGFTDFTYGVNVPVTHHRTAVLQDINNDGSPDWIESNQFDTPPNLTPNPAAYERHGVWSNSATQSDLLSSITYDHGASSSFIYTPQVIVDKNATTQTQTVEAVTSTTLNDGIGGSGVTTYSYINGKYFYSTNKTWKKFAGFQKVTITNPDGGKVINYYHQGNGIDTATYEYSDAESEIGKLYRTDITDAAGNLYKRTTIEWAKTLITSVNSDVYFVYPIQTIAETFDGNASERATAETFAYNTTTGNLTTDTNYGEVTVTTPIAYTDIGTDKQVTTYTYATNVGGMYLVSDENVVDQSTVKIREIRHYYDSLALGSVTLGNETKTEKWKIATTYINTQKTYNSYGLPVTSTDERGKVTSYTTYDTYNLYPLTITDPMSHAIQLTYDYMFGAILQKTDFNSDIYITTYDGMGRVLSQQIPEPLTGASTLRETISYGDYSTGASTLEKIFYTDSSVNYKIDDWFDGLGKLIEENRQIDPINFWRNYQAKDYWYDGGGRLIKSSLPYLTLGGGNNRGAGAAALNTTYTYDVLGRVLTATNTLGVTTTSYDDWKTTVTDPNTNVKKYYTDAYDNLVKVDEINGVSTYTTVYAWNLNKNLIKITDALSNVRNFTYDGLGRRLTAEDLHVSTDTSFGSWSYTYDDAGNITQSISPNAATVNYTYDNAGRKLTEDNIGVVGTEITYTYDTCTQGIGKLCTVTMLTGTGANTAYTYNYDGAVASENKTINSTSFLTSYIYNLAGDITSITYPDNSVVQYSYISDGLINSVQQKESGGSFATVVNSITYTPNFAISYIHYVNGDSTTITNDATKMYRTTRRLSIDGTPSNIQDSNYTYDANGNITNYIDASIQDTSKTVAYTYDALNRIKTATATGVHSGTTAYAETYNYDALGNISSKNGLTYLYQGNTGTLKTNPDGATSINGVTYTYDADGNLTTNGTITNTWNYKDQVTQTVKGATTVNYYYDQEGNRVWYKVGTTNTYYPNKYYNYDGTTKTKQIYLGNQLIGTFKTVAGVTTPWYIIGDNILGTSLAISNTGAVTQVLDYLPFGDIRLNEKTGTIDEKNKFGGHEYDTETDLNYFGARYYNAKIGRFISEDPSFLMIGDSNQTKNITGQDLQQLLMDPQSLNSYSYVENNPLIKIDPDGKYWQLSASATALGWSGEVGIRGDTTGLNLVVSGGLGVGLEGKPLSLSYTPGEVNHEVETSTVVGGSGAYFAGLGISREGTYIPSTYSLANSSVQKSLILGLGLDAYARKEISVPILGKQQFAAVTRQHAVEYMSSGKNQLQANMSKGTNTSTSTQNNFSPTINNVLKSFKR
ncbi:MAG: SpvB/TcaC N-terminal domain-containing protein [Candidatus Paceibacterota bacterium]